MSDFSEAIKTEIKKSKQTLLYLSDISGLSLDHISKMRQGKRLPQDEEKIKKLISALQCSEKTALSLISMYKIERMGHEQWNCMQEIKKMLEYHSTFLEGSWKNQYGLNKEVRKIKVLQTKTEVMEFIQYVLSCIGDTEEEKIRIITEEIPEMLVEILTQHLNRCHFTCEHLFSLKKNRDPGGSLCNIRFINQIMPLIQSEGKYIPYYDYEDTGEEMLPNWIMGKEWAIGLRGNMGGGIVLWDKEQIEYLEYLFERKKRNKRQLLKCFDDLTQWIEEVNERKGRYLKENEGNSFRSFDAKNYYLETTPCLWFLIPMELLEKHILLEKEEKNQLMELVRHRITQLYQENRVLFFTIEGIERIADEGRFSGIPENIYSPLTMSERKIVLEKYLQWMVKKESQYFIIDTSQLDLAPQTSVYSTVSLADNEVSFCMAVGKNTYCSIREAGVAEKINQFCHMMEDGEFVYSREKGIDLIRKIINNCEESV